MTSANIFKKKGSKKKKKLGEIGNRKETLSNYTKIKIDI